MELKLWLSVLLLHVIHIQSSDDEWVANVQTKIPVVQGSCVVIPCSYSYPKPASKKILNRWIGFWKSGKKVISTNLPQWKLPKEYRKRTQFLGNLQALNCTMLLDGVRNTDVGPFYFRIEMPRYKSFTYTDYPVYIDVIRTPEPPSLSAKKVNNKVIASCSVPHTCPMNPPDFTWSLTGFFNRRTKRLNTWKWETASILTFLSGTVTFNKTLTCTVRFRGGKQATSSMILKI